MTEAGDMPRLPPPRFVEREDCAIAWYCAGPEDGPPLVLCHGLAAGALQFADDMAWFAGRGFRVIVPDLRGHGASGMPERPGGESFSIPTMAGDLLAVLDAAEIAATDWVGNSLGGIIALELMGRAPERLKRVVTFGTAYALDLPRAVVPGIGFGYAAFGQPLLARVTARMTCPGTRARQIVLATLMAARPEAVKGMAAHLHRYDLTANARAFANPVLMIRGDGDRAVNLALPNTIAAMADRNNFHIADLAGGGHCANLDRPEQFRQIVMDFLAGAP